MSVESIALFVASGAFVWMGSEFMKTRDAVLKLTTTIHGSEGHGGLHERVEGVAARVHRAEAAVSTLKANQDALDERVVRLENQRQ